MVVWTGPVPELGEAIGACVGLDRAGDWYLANRSQRADPGPGAAEVTWSQYSSRHGAAAGVVGRVPDDVAELLVVLEDGRVLRQEPAGVVAVVWSPVVRPARLVVVDVAGEVVFDGPVADYG
jgi:ferric-dicitrate binding protein FerR (iron transport regulator)